MHWPQVILIVLVAITLGVKIAKHGEPHAPYNAVGGAFDAALFCWILYCGGFFG